MNMPRHYGGDFIRPVGRLSPELAEQDPEGYKHLLLETVRAETKFGGAVWDALARHSEVRMSETKIKLQPQTWVSETRGKHIYLGVQPMTAKERHQLIFEGDLLSGEQEIVHRFVHEMDHLVMPVAGDKAQKIYSVLRQLRSGTGRGLSNVGSLRFYTTPDSQALEDVIELGAMYVKDPEYLDRYLAFLSNTSAQSERDKRKLASVKPAVAHLIGNTIKDIIESFISE